MIIRIGPWQLSLERIQPNDRWEAQVFAEDGGMLYFAPNRASRIEALRDASLLREGKYHEFATATIRVRNTRTGEFVT